MPHLVHSILGILGLLFPRLVVVVVLPFLLAYRVRAPSIPQAWQLITIEI